jgi:Zn-dependent peptidase ImmA (M78 family)/transcriptional regulator with XRE-family HTH domain
MLHEVGEIGVRLRQAREGARLPLSVAAQAAGVPLSSLSAAEHGHGLTADLIYRVATAYGLDEADLLEDEFSDSAVSMLLKGDPRRDELALHIGRFAAICRERTILDELLEQPTQGRVAGFLPQEPTHPPYHQAEKLADKARQQLQLGVAPIRSVANLMQELGVHIVWTEQLHEDLQGLSLYDPSVGLSVVVNLRGRRGHWWMARSILAHELCHILFDRVPARPLGIASRKDQRDDLEQRANAFAVYFLAPRRGVMKFLKERGRREYHIDHNDLHELMIHFGIGKDLATWHLFHLGWITEPQRIELLGYRYPVEQDMLESPLQRADLQPFIERGVDMERLTLVRPAVTAYERGLITLGYLQEALGLSPYVSVADLVVPPKEVHEHLHS